MYKIIRNYITVMITWTAVDGKNTRIIDNTNFDKITKATKSSAFTKIIMITSIPVTSVLSLL